MENMKSTLIMTGLVLGFALVMQTYATGLSKIDSDVHSKALKDAIPIVKKSILLSTGIQMKYREAGNPDGRTILLIHGYTDTSRSFEKVMEELLEKDPNLRLIAPDLRGHGESSMPTPSNSNAFEISDITEDLLDFMKLKNISKVDLVGHSMGSVIAQEIALKHPKKVVSLTMIGALMNGKKNSAIQDFLMPELIGKWEQQLRGRFGTDWKIKSYSLTPKDLGEEATTFLKENWVTDADSNPSLLKTIYLETIEIPLATWIGALKALSEVDNSQRMKKLKVPTLIIWGSGDDLTTKLDQDRLLSSCEAAYERNATPIYFRSYRGDGSGSSLPGHNMHWGNAKKVASDILEFMGSSSPFGTEEVKVKTTYFNKK